MRLLEAQVQELKARLPPGAAAMTVQVKICGINDPVAFDTAIAAGADWVGFNFFPPSPRYRHAGTRGRAIGTLARRSAARGAVRRSDAGDDRRARSIPCGWTSCSSTARWIFPRCVPASVCRSGARSGVAAAADLPAGAGGADRLLVEAKPPPGATRPGGNAVRFDWSLLRGWSAPAPWILAGGLTSDNVAEAIHVTGASAVDVSSGVENARGVKDPALIRAFIANARTASPSSPPPLCGRGVGGGGRPCSTHPKCRNTQPSISDPPPKQTPQTWPRSTSRPGVRRMPE